MPRSIRPPEILLFAACLALGLLAWLAPPLAQPAHYHQFADQRSWLGIPLAMDVLSNLPFAGFGLVGLLGLRRLPVAALALAQRRLLALFFSGLLLTAICSALYHWQPDNAGLALDRCGMVVAFAGLLGLAVAGRISARVGGLLALAVLLLGPLSVWVWAQSGNVLPWAVLQFGGLALLLALAGLRPLPGALAVRWGSVILLYVVAKVLEQADHAVFELSGQLLSGHSLKHGVAALAAWPLICAVQKLGQNPTGSTGACPGARGAAARQQQIKEETALRDFDDTWPPTQQAAAHDVHPNQFALLRQRRFAPFFWTQFCGAANDNLFKFAFTVMVTYQLSIGWLPPAMAGLVIGALFILPFLLFSATSGQLTDKFEKTAMIRFVKNLEIAIMAVAAWGFIMGNVPALLFCTFMMGLHSTLFGPVKFAYLPQVLHERELTGGNGMVEMGTFVAILLGNVVGGLIVAMPEVGHQNVAFACVGLAVLGRVTAARIPRVPATDPGLKINWNPVSETWRNLKLAHGNIVVFRSLLGISWMWFFGAVFLSQFPSFAKEVLHGDAHVASALLVVFSIGIGIGSLLCEMLSRRHVEIGLVPLGAIGMTVFAIDLYFASRGLPASEVMGLAAFLAQPAHWRVMADLLLLSLFAGLYSVPMYALIQLRSPATHRARIIAANNILNALFMIASSLIAGALLAMDVTIPQIFFLVGLANAVVALYIFLLVPEYLLRFVAWVLSHFVYRFKVTGDDNIPTEGAAILACNHVSFVDAVLLQAASPRPIRFLMDHRIFKVPVLGWLFKLAKAIPIAPRHEDPEAYEAAFKAAADVLKDGDLLGIFPEGGITQDGTLQEFKGGIMKILEQQPVPVVPMALTNLWGSFFSRIELVGGKPTAMAKPFRRGVFNAVGLNVGTPLAAGEVQLEELRGRVADLLGLA